jgi:DNA-binding MarR family transcriptional regulator
MKPQANRAASRAEALEQVMGLMRDNGHLTRRLFRRHMKAMDLTGGEARALLYLGAHPGIAQGRLAEIMEVQPIVLSRTVDRLAEAGFVERRLSETDRRLRLLYLTPEGKVLTRRLNRVQDELDRAATAMLSEDELRQLAQRLERINQALRETD